MSEIPQILIVDDSRDIREPLAHYLKQNGLRVTVAESAADARDKMRARHFDLVVLDIMMPGEDGISFCRRLRETATTPIIFLSARTDEIDRVLGFEMGADDYVAKPFSPRELLARINAVLRRANELPPRSKLSSAKAVAFDRWMFRLPERELIRDDGQVIALSGAEFRLLAAFVEHPQVVMSREQLLERLRGRAAEDVFDRSIDTQVSRLRRKLEIDPKEPRLIRTARNEGYVLAAEVTPA